MIKCFIQGLFKGLLFACGTTLLFWNSPLYLRDIFNENDVIELLYPIILAFLIFLIFLGTTAAKKHQRLLIIKTVKENLGDLPRSWQWFNIVIVGIVLALSTFLTAMTPLSAVLHALFLDQKNYTFVMGMLLVFIMSKSIKKISGKKS